MKDGLGLEIELGRVDSADIFDEMLLCDDVVLVVKFSAR